jgi:hypothetical protein
VRDFNGCTFNAKERFSARHLNRVQLSSPSRLMINRFVVVSITLKIGYHKPGAFSNA